jgi:hypothetical protein
MLRRNNIQDDHRLLTTMQAFDTEESVRLRKNIDSVQGRYAHLLSLTVLVMLLLAAGIVLR